MYCPAHFEETRADVLHALLRDQPLGLLVTQGAQGLEANTLPFLYEPQAGGAGLLRAHVARANPVWREARRDVESLVVFQGPQAYISPRWYATKHETGKVVPTWNYVVCEARGLLQVRDDAAWMRGFLAELTRRHEAAMPQPWAPGDAPADFIDKLIGQVVGLEIPLRTLTGKWKVSQNRPVADREGVVHGLQTPAASGDAAEMAALVAAVQGR